MAWFKKIPEEISDYLRYDPETGKLYWKKRTGTKTTVGKEAGNVSPKGYIRVRFKGTSYQAHRIIWMIVYKEVPDTDIDHADLDKSNNRLSNLRLASRGQNMSNVLVHANNTSGYKGVSRCSRQKNWTAYITADGKRTYLGKYPTPEDAHAAYAHAAKQFHGEYARSDRRVDNLHSPRRLRIGTGRIRKPNKNNLTGLRGVSIRKCGTKTTWVATIMIDGKRIWLGSHPTPEEAHAAYVRAADRHFDEYARIT